MKQLKSSSAIKANARQLLLGKYNTVILAYVITEVLVTVCLSFFQTPGNLNSPAGLFIYYAGYFIIVLLSAVFTIGQNCLYLNIYRQKEFSANDIWYGFRYCADRTLITNLIILGKSILCTLPCIIAAIIMIISQNYYLSLLVAACTVFTLITVTIINLDYSQALYLVLDYPDKSAQEILAMSKALMKGHRGSYFYLLASFIGIFLLAALTFGIGMLWIYPYFTATKTGYYLELSNISKQ